MASYDGHINIDTAVDGKGLSRGLNKLGGVAKSAIGGAVKVIGGAATALGGLGVAATKVGMDFESAMSGVKAVSGATEAEMQKLTAAAMQAGKDTVYSAGESANAIEELLKAGLTVEQVLGGGLTGALNLASAGELGLAEAAEVASTVLNAFRADNLSVADAANLLAGAANASATDVGELKYGLSMASAVASGVGMTFKDTATALAVFAQNGLKGSDAGTSLKTMLSRLTPLTDTQAAAMDRLGLLTEEGTSKFYDAQGRVKSLAEISALLQEKLGGLNDEARQKALYQLFGSDAIRAGTILFREGAQGVNDMADAMTKISAADVAATRLDNLAGDVEFLRGSLETLGIAVYNGAQGPLRALAQEATRSIDTLQTAFDSGGLQGLVGAIGTVLSQWVTRLSQAAPQLISGAVSLIQSFITGLVANLPQILTTGGQIVGTLVQGIRAIGGSMGQLGGSLLTSLEQSIAAGAPAKMAQSATTTITNLVNGFTTALPRIISAGLEILSQLAYGVIQALPQLIPAAMNAINTLVSGIKQYLPYLVQAASVIIGQLVSGIAQALPTLVPAAVDAVLTLVESLTSPPSLNMLINAALELITSLITGIINSLPRIVQSAGQIIGNLIQGLITAIPKLIECAGQLVAAIIDMMFKTNWLEVGVNIVKGIINGLFSMLDNLGEAVVNLAKSIWGTITNWFGIHSPSVKMRFVGEMLDEGVIDGIDDNTRKVQKSAAGLSRAVYDAAMNQQGAMAARYGSTSSVARAALTPALAGTGGASFDYAQMVRAMKAAGLGKVDVLMDNKKVGESVEPRVSDIQGRKTRSMTRSGYRG